MEKGQQKEESLSHATFQNSLCADIRAHIQVIVFQGLNKISPYPQAVLLDHFSIYTTHRHKNHDSLREAGEECSSAILVQRDSGCRELPTGLGSKGHRGGEGDRGGRKGRENPLVSREKHPVGCVHLPRLHFTCSISSLCHSHTGK